MTTKKMSNSLRILFAVALGLKFVDFAYAFIKLVVIGHEPVFHFIASKISDLSSIVLFVCILLIYNRRTPQNA